ncbi:MAG: hypothetical protein PVG50_08210 [Thiohalophilus sp.]|jgi:hypothetical protein
MTRLWKTATFATLLGLSSLFVNGTAGADTLEMPKLGPPAVDEPAAPATSVTVPGRGMTMTQVEERFGQPVKKYDEVGDPPITRWVYPDFTVYFEYQYVIDAVAHDEVGAP